LTGHNKAQFSGRHRSMPLFGKILSFIGRFSAGFPVMSGLFVGTQCELSFFTIVWPGMSPA